MNNIDQQYKALLQDILDNGVEKKDRTRTGTRSVFGRQIRHKMSDGFPLITTKKMAWKSIVVELLWFLRGDTNIKYLVDNDCHIWDGDCFANYVRNFTKYVDSLPEDSEIEFIINKDKFINKIKTDAEFAEKWGELGPIYGKQWRQWQGYTKEGWSMWYDQIQRVLHLLKTDPDSRRMMVSAWNVGELDQMVLPPCHYGWQVYTRELSGEERMELYQTGEYTNGIVKLGGVQWEHEWMDTWEPNVPKRAISLMWNQRSVDTPLGLPFNIASYGLLLMLLAKEVNMVPDELIGNLGDCHIYNNQIDGIKEQLTREPYPLPKVQLDFDYSYFDGYIVEWDKIAIEQIKLVDYQSHPAIKIPLSN
jgi:thymidylate synthase